MEINTVLRETCDRVWNDPIILHNMAVLRAAALKMLGESFMAVRDE